MNKQLRRSICIGLTIFIFYTLPFQTVFAVTDSKVLSKGMSGDNITKLQKDLKKLGYIDCEPTGYYGALTQTAVIKFQKKYKLSATGKADKNTLSKITIILKRSAVKIAIDPGHGGIDVGTSKGKITESSLNLSISKLLKASLVYDAYGVILTRDTDIALSNLSQNGDTIEERDLNARTNIMNKSGAKLFVSVHLNSYTESPSTSGSIVYYNDKFPKSKVLAEKIQQELNKVIFGKWQRQAHDPQEANYYVLRNSNISGVLIETGFITNSKEFSLLSTDNYKDKIAKAIEQGINNFIDF